MRILFVDNEQFFVLPYIDKLEMQGHNVYPYYSVAELLKKLKKGEKPHYDVAVIDLMMPLDGPFSEKETLKGQATGVILAEWLRKEYPTLAKMPVAFLTNVERNTKAGEAVYNKAMELNRVEWISKSDVLPSQLAARLERLVKKWSGK